MRLYITLMKPIATFVSRVSLCALLAGCTTGSYVNPPKGPPESLGPTPDSLKFTSIGPNFAQTLSLTNTPPGSAVQESDNCSAGSVRIVSVSGPSQGPLGTVTFSVSPVTIGTCTLTFKNAAGASTEVPVTVSG